MTIIGIDLGRHFVKISYTDHLNRSTLIVDEMGKRYIPSHITISKNDKILIGYAAQNYSKRCVSYLLPNLVSIIGRDIDEVKKQIQMEKHDTSHLCHVVSSTALPTPKTPTSPSSLSSRNNVFIKIDFSSPIHSTDKKTSRPNPRYHRFYSIHQIAQLYFKRLKQIAERGIGSLVIGCVIAISDQYNTPKLRRALGMATQCAEIPCIRFINSSTSSLLAYRLDEKIIELSATVLSQPGHPDQRTNHHINSCQPTHHHNQLITDEDIFIIDFGDELTLTYFELKMNGLICKLDQSSNPNITGHHFDQSLIQYCLEDIKNKTHLDLNNIKHKLINHANDDDDTNNENGNSNHFRDLIKVNTILERLRMKCKRSKIELNHSKQTLILFESLNLTPLKHYSSNLSSSESSNDTKSVFLSNSLVINNLQYLITQSKFEMLNNSLLRAVSDAINIFLYQYILSKKEDMTLKGKPIRIILSGGNMLIPKIDNYINLIARYIHKEAKRSVYLHKSISPLENTVIGAAYQAAILRTVFVERYERMQLIDGLRMNSSSKSRRKKMNRKKIDHETITILKKELDMIPVLRLPIGIKDQTSKKLIQLIPKHIPLPIHRIVHLNFPIDRFEGIQIELYEGELPDIDKNHKLGEIRLSLEQLLLSYQEHQFSESRYPRLHLKLTFSIDMNGYMSLVISSMKTKIVRDFRKLVYFNKDLEATSISSLS